MTGLRRVIGVGVYCAVCMGAALAGQRDPNPLVEEGSKSFHRPKGKRAAVSLSYDDARTSQVERRLVRLKEEGVRVTFLVNSEAGKKRLTGRKHAVADGH